MDDLPPSGVSIMLEPAPSAIAALSHHIRTTARTYAVADLAKMILLARDRFQARFKSDAPAERPLYYCPADQSLWLTKEEATSNVLRGPTLQRYYQTEDVTVDPPKGNFSVVAVCGLSGRILGPPNHHEYSLNVVRLHRERFSDMPFDRYKSRIEMHRDEETIGKWKAEISTRRQYRIRPEPLPIGSTPGEGREPERVSAPAEGDEGPTVEPETADDATPSEGTEESVSEAATPDEPTPATDAVESSDVEPSAESAEDETLPEDTPSDEAESSSTEADDSQVLKSAEAMERHFKQHFAEDAIQAVGEAIIPGSISGRSLSRGLLTLLKNEAEHQRRSFPLPMIQRLCRDFEKSGLRFFKRGKKALHVSVTRPRAIADEEALSERVREIIRFIREHPRKKVVDLLDALVSDYQRPPEGETFEQHHLTERERSVLADLRWLTLEGYVIEFPGTELVLAKFDQPPPPAKTPGKGPKKGTTAAVLAADESPVAAAPTVAEEATPVAEVTPEAQPEPEIETPGPIGELPPGEVEEMEETGTDAVAPGEPVEDEAAPEIPEEASPETP